MEKLSLISLFILLILLIVISAFFSAAETGIISINRYRLRHLVRQKNRAAIRVSKLLEHLERLLSVILIGNTASNIFAASIGTVIGFRFFGDYGVTFASIILTFIVLIFAEIAPKTFAANYPQPIAFFASWPLKILLKIFYPLILFVNWITLSFLKLFRFRVKRPMVEHLTSEELITVVKEASALIPDQHQAMLLAILNLEKITVNDVMVPRSDIVGIDLMQDWSTVVDKIIHSSYSHLPLYYGDVNDIKGILHTRIVLKLLKENRLEKNILLEIADDVYFIPESTPLHDQLLNFRNVRKRMGLVVDEYGDIIGLVTLEDILEEIVGEFATGIASVYKDIQPQPDGSYLVDGSVSVRDLNRIAELDFDITGPKTLSGSIVEHLEIIPQSPLCLRLSGYPIEILKIEGNTISLARIIPKLRRLLATTLDI